MIYTYIEEEIECLPELAINNGGEKERMPEWTEYARARNRLVESLWCGHYCGAQIAEQPSKLGSGI